jgi:uncharacterized membrane protein HdeD (DUF308 family)
VVVAVGILLLLGAVLVTATARWQASDVRDIIETLAPVLGVVTGAFVTYFFTRQASVAATEAAQTATDVAARTVSDASAQTERSRVLHNALTTAVTMVDENTGRLMRENPTIKAALEGR